MNIKNFISIGALIALTTSQCWGAALTPTPNEQLIQAAQAGRVDLIEQALQRRETDINGRGSFGRTALMEAVFWGHRDALEKLLEKGANIQLVDDFGSSALDMAIRHDRSDAVRLIFNAYPKNMQNQILQQKLKQNFSKEALISMGILQQ